MEHDFIKAYNEAVFDTNKIKVNEVIELALTEGYTPEDVVFNIVIPSLDSMMFRLAEKGEVNLTQHFFASQIASEITENLIEKFVSTPENQSAVIIGTSPGDFHGLGKRIVTGCLKAHMMEVVDLGLNVAPEKFVEAAVLHEANVIAISSMMYHTATGENGCLKVRNILKENKLESKIKIIVGGAPYRFDPKLYQIVQADAWAENGNLAGIVISHLISVCP
ncbi:MAG: cobalamin-dependent protein [Bacteroidales bacterium]|nr:cobalamin-dependent protein [Bacteroidales bacterium]